MRENEDEACIERGKGTDRRKGSITSLLALPNLTFFERR